MTAVVGIDLAIRSTGWAMWGRPYGRIRTDLTATKGLSHIARRRHIALAVANLITTTPALVVMEAPWVGPGAIATVMLHGVVLDRVAQTGASICLVSPSALKRFACGKGTADKGEMVAAAQAAGYPGDHHDEGDAWLLALLGHHLTGGADYASPHRASCLAAVSWEVPLPAGRATGVGS